MFGAQTLRMTIVDVGENKKKDGLLFYVRAPPLHRKPWRLEVWHETPLRVRDMRACRAHRPTENRLLEVWDETPLRVRDVRAFCAHCPTERPGYSK